MLWTVTLLFQKTTIQPLSTRTKNISSESVTIIIEEWLQQISQGSNNSLSINIGQSGSQLVHKQTHAHSLLLLMNEKHFIALIFHFICVCMCKWIETNFGQYLCLKYEYIDSRIMCWHPSSETIKTTYSRKHGSLLLQRSHKHLYCFNKHLTVALGNKP